MKRLLPHWLDNDPPKLLNFESMKTCTKCLVTKPLFDFYKQTKAPDGKQNYCKACSAEKSIRWRENNPSYHTNDQYRRKYGLTTEQVQQMVEDQNRKCAICATELQGKYLQAVDHCHNYPPVFRDNTDSLRKAAEYLEQHRGENPPVNG